MSPQRILSKELYHDRTVQDWHRAVFCTNSTAIDIDLCGYCPKCRAPLYLIEATTNPTKTASVVAELAHRAGASAFIIRHESDGVLVEATDVATGVRYLGEDSIRTRLAVIRLTHVRAEHPEQRFLARQYAHDAGVKLS